MHKGPLAYAEAFLEPNKFNRNYAKDLKRKFKVTFKRLVDSYQKGIDLYQQLAIKANQISSEEATSSAGMKNSSLINTSALNFTNVLAASSTSSTNTAANTNANAHVYSSLKYFEMSRLLQEKFNELENSFRNLLLIDGVN